MKHSRRYIAYMTKPYPRIDDAPGAPGKIIHDPSTGRMVEVRGYGALKGQFNIAKGVDLTKPIYDQVQKKLARSLAKHP